MPIIILLTGTRLFCSSRLDLVTLISMGKIQDGCNMIKLIDHQSNAIAAMAAPILLGSRQCNVLYMKTWKNRHLFKFLCEGVFLTDVHKFWQDSMKYWCVEDWPWIFTLQKLYRNWTPSMTQTIGEFKRERCTALSILKCVQSANVFDRMSVFTFCLVSNN